MLRIGLAPIMTWLATAMELLTLWESLETVSVGGDGCN